MDGAEPSLDQPEIQAEIVGDLEIWSQFQFRLVDDPYPTVRSDPIA